MVRPQGNLHPQEGLGGQILAQQTLALPLCPRRIASTASTLVQIPSSLRWLPDHLTLPGASYGQPEYSGTPLRSCPGFLCPWGVTPKPHPSPHSPHNCLCLHSLTSPTSLESLMPYTLSRGLLLLLDPCLALSSPSPKSAPSLPTDRTLRSALCRLP